MESSPKTDRFTERQEGKRSPQAVERKDEYPAFPLSLGLAFTWCLMVRRHRVGRRAQAGETLLETLSGNFRAISSQILEQIMKLFSTEKNRRELEAVHSLP